MGRRQHADRICLVRGNDNLCTGDAALRARNPPLGEVCIPKELCKRVKRTLQDTQSEILAARTRSTSSCGHTSSRSPSASSCSPSISKPSSRQCPNLPAWCAPSPSQPLAQSSARSAHTMRSRAPSLLRGSMRQSSGEKYCEPQYDEFGGCLLTFAPLPCSATYVGGTINFLATAGEAFSESHYDHSSGCVLNSTQSHHQLSGDCRRGRVA